MKSILILLLATIVTTRFVEAHREPKVLVYEVSERDGEDPQIQLLKVEDFDEAVKEDEIYQDQALSQYQQYKSHNKNKNRNRHTSNRQSVNFADEYDIKNYKDSNRHKSHSKSNHFKSYQKYLKQKDTSRNQNLENIFIDWTKQQNNNDNQDQIYDYLQQKLQQNEKQSARNSKKKQKNFDDDYFDLGDVKVNRQEDVLLSQLLKPLKRHKREAERSSIINKLKQLLRRLQEIDDDGEARIDGKVYINKQSDANDWNQDSSDLRHSIQINQSPALRSGDQLDADFNFEEVLGDDRTMPPPPRSKYDVPEY